VPSNDVAGYRLVVELGPGKALNADARGMLGRFLRERRLRVTMEQAGLPARRGSRAGTLTQEDLARLTGYSVRTISGLEQGTAHRPTPDLLEAITVALGLTADERYTLWYLATDAPPPVPASQDDGLDPALVQLADAIDPHIAYVTDASRNVQAANQACAAWAFDPATMSDNERNLAHWVFLNPHAHHVFPYWEREIARSLFASLRTQLARPPRSQQLKSLIEELCDRSTAARRLWDTHMDTSTHPPARVSMRIPGHTDPGQLDDQKYHISATVCMLTPTRPDDEHRITAFILPAEHARTYPLSSRQACSACAGEKHGE
jgi:transcriptional regulator with XRE-family HTH domain